MDSIESIIWERQGACNVCKFCGFVEEGTADATIRHHNRCGAAVVYGKMRAAVAVEREACLGILAAAIPSHDDARRDLDRRARREQDSGDRLGAEMTSIAASKHSGAASALHVAIKSIRARWEVPRCACDGDAAEIARLRAQVATLTEERDTARRLMTMMREQYEARDRAVEEAAASAAQWVRGWDAEVERLRAKLAPIEAAARAYHAACEAPRVEGNDVRARAQARGRAWDALADAGYALLDEAPPFVASIRAVGHCEEPGCDDGPACACLCGDCREAVAVPQ